MVWHKKAIEYWEMAMIGTDREHLRCSSPPSRDRRNSLLLEEWVGFATEGGTYCGPDRLWLLSKRRMFDSALQRMECNNVQAMLTLTS